MVVVVGHVTGVAAGHLAGRVAERVPDRRRTAVFRDGALDLVGRGGRAPDEVRRGNVSRSVAAAAAAEESSVDVIVRLPRDEQRTSWFLQRSVDLGIIDQGRDRPGRRQVMAAGRSALPVSRRLA